MDKTKGKQESPEAQKKFTRKKIPIINVSEAGITERKIKSSYKHLDKFDNIEKIVFKCQPKSHDPNHSSLDSIGKNTPIIEVIYRLIVNNRGQMKLGDITSRTLEILKGRKLAKIPESENVHIYFYRIIKGNRTYSFEEVE